MYGESADAPTRGFLVVFKGAGIPPLAVGVDVAKGVSDYLGGYNDNC